MSFSNLKSQFPAVHQITSLNINTIQLAVLILGLIKFVLTRIILNRKGISQNFMGFIKSHFLSSDSTKLDNFEQSTTEQSEKRVDDDDQTSVCKEEMEIVLRSLGMLTGNGEYEPESKGNIPARLDILGIFDGERNIPRLDEVREAFDVFDDNRDGFIDANELQKVMCALDLKEGLDMENCRRMIGAFDGNGDGRIDFDEFVNFMEISFT